MSRTTWSGTARRRGRWYSWTASPAGPTRDVIAQKLTVRDMGNADNAQRSARLSACAPAARSQYPHPHLPFISRRRPPGRYQVDDRPTPAVTRGGYNGVMTTACRGRRSAQHAGGGTGAIPQGPVGPPGADGASSSGPEPPERVIVHVRPPVWGDTGRPGRRAGSWCSPAGGNWVVRKDPARYVRPRPDSGWHAARALRSGGVG